MHMQEMVNLHALANGGKSVLITYPTLYNQGSSVPFTLYFPM